MRFWMKDQTSPSSAREMGLWMALLMLLGQHFFDGPLNDAQVASSVGGGIGIWLVFRFLFSRRPSRAA